MRKLSVLAGAYSAVLLLAGCMNMPTPAAQITGTYTSGLRYESLDCPRLAVEWDSLSRRESQLVVAQEQRVKTSQVQAFWWGMGQGDGIEASELANVRGEKEAVRKAMAGRRCEPAIQPTTPEGSAPPPAKEQCILNTAGQCMR